MQPWRALAVKVGACRLMPWGQDQGRSLVRVRNMCRGRCDWQLRGGCVLAVAQQGPGVEAGGPPAVAGYGRPVPARDGRRLTAGNWGSGGSGPLQSVG